MLIRISLIVAILGGLAVGTLNFVKVKEKITKLQADLDFQTKRAEKAETELASTKKDLDKTKTELTQTKAALETTTAQKLGPNCEMKVECDPRAGEKCAFALAEQTGGTTTDTGTAKNHYHRLQGPGASIILPCNSRSAPFRLCCK